jgi:hypothetical protein
MSELYQKNLKVNGTSAGIASARGIDALIPNFHAEWYSFGRHRIWIEVRCGAPGETLRAIAREVALECERFDERARVVEVFFDDKRAWPIVSVATDSGITILDREAGESDDGQYFSIDVETYPVSPYQNSDSYDHTCEMVERHFAAKHGN